MSKNKTSEAVDNLFKEEMSLMLLSAFQVKYKKMEKALKEWTEYSSHEEHCSGEPCDCFLKIAKEAIYFDPLKDE